MRLCGCKSSVIPPVSLYPNAPALAVQLDGANFGFGSLGQVDMPGSIEGGVSCGRQSRIYILATDRYRTGGSTLRVSAMRGAARDSVSLISVWQFGQTICGSIMALIP